MLLVCKTTRSALTSHCVVSRRVHARTLPIWDLVDVIVMRTKSDKVKADPAAFPHSVVCRNLRLPLGFVDVVVM